MRIKAKIIMYTVYFLNTKKAAWVGYNTFPWSNIYVRLQLIWKTELILLNRS